MEKRVNITIDGVHIRAPEHTSVLDTAIEFGICIPHLCHYPGVPDIGACRLCIVENVVRGKPRVTTSCTLKVREGMEIHTNTDRIQQLRKNVAEMLVAEAPNSKAVQDVAVRCGVTDVPYKFHNEECVLCGRCVRVCNDVWQAKALGFVGRGRDRHVAFPFEKKPDFCKHCESCVDLCPMNRTPCPGPMKKGEEFVCGQCESQLSMAEDVDDSCVWCRLGDGFGCTRKVQAQ